MHYTLIQSESDSHFFHDTDHPDVKNINTIGENNHSLCTQANGSTHTSPPAISEINQSMKIYEFIKEKLADAASRDVPNAVTFYGHLKQWFQCKGQIDCNTVQTWIDCFERAMTALLSQEDEEDVCFYERCVKNFIDRFRSDFPLPNQDFV